MFKNTMQTLNLGSINSKFPYVRIGIHKVIELAVVTLIFFYFFYHCPYLNVFNSRQNR